MVASKRTLLFRLHSQWEGIPKCDHLSYGFDCLQDTKQNRRVPLPDRIHIRHLQPCMVHPACRH
jgi:hypothetical protein